MAWRSSASFRHSLVPMFLLLILLVALPTSGNLLSLALSSSCSYGRDAVECAAGQWSVAGPARHFFEGEISHLSADESCFEDAISGFDSIVNSSSNSDKAVIIPRGGCSFGRKALNAQRCVVRAFIAYIRARSFIPFHTRLGFGALVIVNNIPEVLPPALGPDSDAVKIPVVLVPPATFSDKLCDGRKFRLQLSAPSEAQLWQGSPWYSKSAVLSHTSTSAKKFAPSCNRSETSLVSDDHWLYDLWLEELAPERCFEIHRLPGPTLTHGSANSTVIDLLVASLSGSAGYGVVKLPHLDATGESMKDAQLLQWSATAYSLQGLNSNSHHFPWENRNVYPRLFRANALVVRGACVFKDGVVVSHRGEAEFHAGGCGCCPLGHGEGQHELPAFGNNQVTNITFPKMVTLVQRFHHGACLKH